MKISKEHADVKSMASKVAELEKRNRSQQEIIEKQS